MFSENSTVVNNCNLTVNVRENQTTWKLCPQVMISDFTLVSIFGITLYIITPGNKEKPGRQNMCWTKRSILDKNIFYHWWILCSVAFNKFVCFTFFCQSAFWFYGTLTLKEWGTMNLEIEGLKCHYWPGLGIEFANLGLRLDWIGANLEIEGLKCDFLLGLRTEFANLGLRLDWIGAKYRFVVSP